MSALGAIKDKVVEVANTPVSELAMWRSFRFPRVKCTINGREVFTMGNKGKKRGDLVKFETRHGEVKFRKSPPVPAPMPEPEPVMPARAYQPQISKRVGIRITPKTPRLRR